MSLAPYVVMGGTFDPIHHGHLRTALEIQQWLGVDRVYLMPAKRPVHREAPGCSAKDRLAMVQCAVADEAALGCDPREIESDEASYTVLTLERLRAQLGPTTPIVISMGMDAFMGLDQWYRYQELLTLANIVVVARPGYECTPNAAIQALIDRHQASDVRLMTTRPHGVLMIQELTPLDVSATQIRTQLGTGVSPRYLLPDVVLNYIYDNALYHSGSEH
jgi:nicotinate-nucleotide adenylyltransferase